MFAKQYDGFYIKYPVSLEIGFQALERETGLERDGILSRLGLPKLENKYPRIKGEVANTVSSRMIGAKC